jgi:anti-sigma B factor antagonist
MGDGEGRAWSYAIEGSADRPVVCLSGDIDLAAADELRRALMAAAAIAVRIEVDLSGVTFLDSCGIAALVASRNVAHDHQCELVVSRLSPQASRVLEITGLLRSLTARPSGDVPSGGFKAKP